jgi:hypothetical protein
VGQRQDVRPLDGIPVDEHQPRIPLVQGA